jgi:uridine kinase
MHLPPEEPDVATWRARDVSALVGSLVDGAHAAAGLVVVAVDGRSAGGKTTLAQRLVAAHPAAALVHTDDVAWNHSFFGWDDVLAAGVLEPARRGEVVTFRPPPWEEHERPGAIEVPAGTRLLVVEGVGSSRRALADLVDASVWVQSDVVEARRRGIARDIQLGRTPAAAVDFWDRWDAEEVAFLAADRPWERADVIACGTPGLTDVPVSTTEVLVASAWQPASPR